MDGDGEPDERYWQRWKEEQGTRKGNRYKYRGLILVPKVLPALGPEKRMMSATPGAIHYRASHWPEALTLFPTPTYEYL